MTVLTMKCPIDRILKLDFYSLYALYTHNLFLNDVKVKLFYYCFAHIYSFNPPKNNQCKSCES